MDVEAELAKLRYHVKLLGEKLDERDHPMACLAIRMNWSQDDIEAALDILEKYDNEDDSKIHTHGLEMDLRNRFQIGYQEVKTIITCFYWHMNFPGVCLAYIKSHPQPPSEFHEVLEDAED